MRSAASLRLPLLLALAMVTCQRATPATEPTTAPTDAPTRPKVDDRKAPTPAADPTHPLELVPARARAVIMVRSPQRLAQIWERERFVGRFPAEYERMVADMKREVGHDLLDPSGLAAIGIDPSAPLGVAVLSFQDEVFVVFGGTGNPTAMLETLRKGTGKPLPPEVVGEAQIVRVDGELALVLRHGMFAMVVDDRHDDGGPDYARELARIDPAQSLAHSATMERAHAGLPHEADVHAMLDIAGIIHDELDRSRRREQEMVGEVSRRLAEARQRGASAEELASLQQQVQHQQEFVVRHRRERQVAEILLSRTLGAVEGIGLTVDADAARGLLGRIHLALTPDAMFRELLVASDRPPAAIVALGDAPQLVLSAQVDPGIAIDLFAQAAMATGSSYAEVNEEVLRGLRVDFDRAVRPLLDGRGTFVLTTPPSLDPKRAKVDEAVGGLLALGVNDEAKARALLDEVVGKHGDQRFTPMPEISGWTLTRSEHPREIHLGVVAGQLVVGTDIAAFRRLRDGQAGPASGQFPDPEPWQRLTEGAGAGRLALHHRLPSAAVFAFAGAFGSFDFPRNPDNDLSEEFPGEDVFSVPRSPATLRSDTEHEKAFAAKSKLQERKRNELQAAAWNLAGALGITAGVVREVDTGLVIEGGHYVAGGLFGYAETIVGLVRAAKGESDDPELARAQKRREQAYARLLEARRKDVQRAIRKRGSQPPPPAPEG
jgi:hypothetical protein